MTLEREPMPGFPRGRGCCILLVLALALPGCESGRIGCPPPTTPPRHPERVSVPQGVWGDVWFWDGDFQPACITGTISAVSRQVFIHAVTPYDSLVVAPRGPAFYSAIHTPLVAVTQSDSTGFFEAQLPPGTYSLFVREDSLFYANWFDGRGNVWPITVITGRVSGTRLDINYRALH
jgi:hypothetical protein